MLESSSQPGLRPHFIKHQGHNGFPEPAILFHNTPRRLELLDALFTVQHCAKSLRDDPDSPRSRQSFLDNTRFQAQYLRHVFQVTFAYLDGDISDIGKVFELLDGERMFMEDELSLLHAGSYSNNIDAEFPGFSSFSWIAEHYRQSHISNSPTDHESFIQLSPHSHGIPFTENRVETDASHSILTPLLTTTPDRAGTGSSACENAAAVTTPLQSSPLSGAVVIRQLRGPSNTPRWKTRSRSSSTVSTPTDTLSASTVLPDSILPSNRPKHRRRNRHPKHRSSKDPTMFATNGSLPILSTVHHKSLRLLMKTIRHTLGFAHHDSLVILLPGT
ncbi:hypothetical protein AAF712_003407 [Marasmius tenuissimus]|uniref:Uncharacterized protein n=1 Tax=Marasmius tenuissimus TaxID=585030 RepID=A0ABR3A8U4_9AGAR